LCSNCCLIVLPRPNTLMTLDVVVSTARTLDRDYFLSAAEAKDWGLIDEVVEQRPAIDDAKK
jgi:ATP-dependent protease ClpP protease subunit